ncbi:MAG: ergothioneine biosynthesis protein EgtB, partial [Balneolaceae bacterium]
MNTGNEVLQRKRDSEIQNESGFSYSRLELIQKFKKTRSCTEVITNSLEIEDFVVQVSENASPAKWH